MVDSVKGNGSILSGCDNIVDKFFGKPKTGYKTRTTYLRRGLEKGTGDACKLLRSLDKQMEENWKRRTRDKPPSKENWRWEQRPDYKSCERGPEVPLEREIVKAMGEDWANQIPTSSGLIDEDHDRARNIDLVHRSGPCEYTFFELKWESNTPIYAAIEILLRGSIYMFARRHSREPAAVRCDVSKVPMLTAKAVHLRVLAPHQFYHKKGISLAWLEEKLHAGLSNFVKDRQDLRMDFGFLMFPECFNESAIKNPEKIKTAMAGLLPAYGT